MKNFFLMFLAAVLTVNVASAQILFIGSAGFDYAGGSRTTGGQTIEMQSKIAFQFSPRVGFVLTENFAVGAGFGISTSTTKTPKNDPSFYPLLPLEDIKQTSTVLSALVFTRAKLVGAQRLTLFLDEVVIVGGVNLKTTGASNPIKGTIFAIEVIPVLAYNFNERLNIAASSDIMKLGFRSTSTVNKGAQDEVKTKTNSFGVGYNSNNLLDGSSLLRVGLTIKFKTGQVATN